MPAARGQITEDANANVPVRDRIGMSHPRVTKEAMQQLTWMGVDPTKMMLALDNAEQIVRVWPEGDDA